MTAPTPKPKDRRALTSAENLRKGGGRPRTVKDLRIYSLGVPADLRDWLRDQGAADVRQALERWRIDSLIV